MVGCVAQIYIFHELRDLKMYWVVLSKLKTHWNIGDLLRWTDFEHPFRINVVATHKCISYCSQVELEVWNRKIKISAFRSRKKRKHTISSWLTDQCPWKYQQQRRDRVSQRVMERKRAYAEYGIIVDKYRFCVCVCRMRILIMSDSLHLMKWDFRLNSSCLEAIKINVVFGFLEWFVFEIYPPFDLTLVICCCCWHAGWAYFHLKRDITRILTGEFEIIGQR